MSQYYTIEELSSSTSLLFKPVSNEEFYQLKYGRQLKTNPSSMIEKSNPQTDTSLLFKPVSNEEFYQLKYGCQLKTNPSSMVEKNIPQIDTSLLFKPVSDEEFYQLKYGRPIESSLAYQQEEKSNIHSDSINIKY